MEKRTLLAAAVLVLAALGLAWASGGDWQDAKDKAHAYKNQEPQLKRQLVDETRTIVKEICAASDDDRKSVASSASYSARSNFGYRYSELERAKNDAINALERVMNDDNQKDHQRDAREMRDEVAHRWNKFEQLSEPLRNSRHPVVEYMLDQGDAARRDRGNHCTGRHVQVGSGHADCIEARFDTCTIVSLTSDSNRSVSAGRDKARRLASLLEEEIKKPGSDIIKRLVDSNSDYARCKRFESRVDCYHLCPDIDDEDRHSRDFASWREGC